MYAVKAIYDGNTFKPKQPISVTGQYEVIITFVEPVDTDRDENPNFLHRPDASKTPVLGRLNGTIDIPEDFKEPLDEMKEYMY